MFFHEITFRSSIDVEFNLDANLIPFCFPNSIQNPWKYRPQEAPDNASIFGPFLDPQKLPLGNQLGTILAINFAQEASQTLPRGFPDPTWCHLGSLIRFKTAQEASGTSPRGLPGPSGGPFLVDFW